MQSFLFLGPTSIDGPGGSGLPHTSSTLFGGNSLNCRRSTTTTNSRRLFAFASSNQNHYAVLGVPPDASFSDIKKAFRVVARKYHPDVSKDSRAGEVFKNIRYAYEVLSNATTRNQYDRKLRLQTDARRSWKDNLNNDPEFEDGERIYQRWGDVRERTRRERTWEGHPFYYGTDEEFEEETPDKERDSIIVVLKSAFLSIFLMKTIGPRLSLTFSSLMALLDQKLDPGYKGGHLIAWVLGGEVGVFLTLCLSFASWVFGKTSSTDVSVVVATMWMGINLARLAIMPQGALITLLYMTIKLQYDLK